MKIVCCKDCMYSNKPKHIKDYLNVCRLKHGKIKEDNEFCESGVGKDIERNTPIEAIFAMNQWLCGRCEFALYDAKKHKTLNVCPECGQKAKFK